jgi:hypothetical protein
MHPPRCAAKIPPPIPEPSYDVPRVSASLLLRRVVRDTSLSPPVKPNAPTQGHSPPVPRFVRESCGEGRSHERTPPCGERHHMLTRPHCAHPTLCRSLPGLNPPSPARRVHQQCNLPPLTSHHARTLVNACHASSPNPIPLVRSTPRASKSYRVWSASLLHCRV